MKELLVRIPDENIKLASQMLEKLGAEIKETKSSSGKQKGVKKIEIKKKKSSKEISPTYLFGKWKNLDIDAKNLREEAWSRNHKFL